MEHLSPTPPLAQQKHSPLRIHSIDSLRALTMLLMVFVNDLSADVPAWLRHAAAKDDALGFSDIIFPAFLFIVGLSIPLAIHNRIHKGDSFQALVMYIVTRAFSLIVMGFFHVNLEAYSDAAAIPRAIWQIMITVCFFLIWLDYPKKLPAAKKNILKATGVAGLIVAALLFKGGSVQDPVGMQMYWGGILGLIGWAYLIVAFLYVVIKDRSLILGVMYFLLTAMNILAHTGGRSFSFFAIGDASSTSITMAGTLATVVYLNSRKKGTVQKLWRTFLAAAFALILFGVSIRPFAEGISKIRSTPAWVLLCTGITLFFFGIFIFIVDLKSKNQWFRIIKPAGTSTLTCYLLPYIVYALYSLFHIRFPEMLEHNTGAVVKSLVFAFVIVQLTGLLEQKRLRLRI